MPADILSSSLLRLFETKNNIEIISNNEESVDFGVLSLEANIIFILV